MLVTLPNLLSFRWWTCLFVSFRLLLIPLALFEDSKFISVYYYTLKLICSLTIFHNLLVLLLSYNCDWGRLPFNKRLSVGSYDFVIAVKIGKMIGPFLAPCVRVWLFSGVDLAPWKKVDLATLPAIDIFGQQESWEDCCWSPVAYPPPVDIETDCSKIFSGRVKPLAITQNY